MSQRFIIEVRPLPDAVPAEVRLRRALKTLLRAFGLRCESIELKGQGRVAWPTKAAEAGRGGVNL